MIVRVVFIWVAFVILTFIMRLVLPFGSEPDFNHRISVILFANDSYLAEFLKMFYKGYSWQQKCEVSYGMSDIYGSISNFSCGEDFYLKINRWLLQNTLFFLVVIFGGGVKHWAGIDGRKKYTAILLSCLFPSMIYYTGVAAEEQIALFISLFIIFFINRPLFLLVLVYFTYQVEVGSTIVITLFIVTYLSLSWLESKFSLRLSEFISIAAMCVCLAFGISLLSLLFYIPMVGEKMQSIHYAYTMTSYADVTNKYPIFFRPVITFLSATFMTSDGVKAIVLYPIAAYVLYVLLKVSRRNEDKHNYILLLSVLTFATCTLFVLPGYSNAKYYIFTLPFIFKVALDYFGFYKVFSFSVLSTLIVILSLVITRI